jgi:hypothetical protein
MPQTLAQLMMRRLLLAYLAFAVVITGIQMFIEYRIERAEIIENLQSLAKTFSPGIESALWELQQPLLQSMVKGIGANPAVVSVNIDETSGNSISASWHAADRIEETPALTVHQVLVHDDGTHREVLGTLKIASSDSVLLSRLTETLWSVGISDVALFLSLGVLLWLMARTLVVRPLALFSNQVGALSAGEPGADIDLGNVKVREIETLKQGFNKLMMQLSASHRRIAEHHRFHSGPDFHQRPGGPVSRVQPGFRGLCRSQGSRIDGKDRPRLLR